MRFYDDILVPLDPLACALEPSGTRVERARVAQHERLVAGRAARGIHRAGQDIASSVHNTQDKKGPGNATTFLHNFPPADRTGWKHGVPNTIRHHDTGSVSQAPVPEGG